MKRSHSPHFVADPELGHPSPSQRPRIDVAKSTIETHKDKDVQQDDDDSEASSPINHDEVPWVRSEDCDPAISLLRRAVVQRCDVEPGNQKLIVSQILQCAADVEQQTRLCQHGWTSLFRPWRNGSGLHQWVIRNAHFRILFRKHDHVLYQRFDLVHECMHYLVLPRTIHTIIRFIVELVVDDQGDEDQPKRYRLRVYGTNCDRSDFYHRTITDDNEAFATECASYGKRNAPPFCAPQHHSTLLLFDGLEHHWNNLETIRSMLRLRREVLFLHHTLRAGLLSQPNILERLLPPPDDSTLFNSSTLFTPDPPTWPPIPSDVLRAYHHWSATDGLLVLLPELHDLVIQYIGTDAVCDARMTTLQNQMYQNEVTEDSTMISLIRLIDLPLWYVFRRFRKAVAREATASLPSSDTIGSAITTKEMTLTQRRAHYRALKHGPQERPSIVAKTCPATSLSWPTVAIGTDQPRTLMDRMQLSIVIDGLDLTVNALRLYEHALDHLATSHIPKHRLVATAEQWVPALQVSLNDWFGRPDIASYMNSMDPSPSPDTLSIHHRMLILLYRASFSV